VEGELEWLRSRGNGFFEQLVELIEPQANREIRDENENENENVDTDEDNDSSVLAEDSEN